MAGLKLDAKNVDIPVTVALTPPLVPPTTAFPLRLEAAHVFAVLAGLLGLTLFVVPTTFGLKPTEASVAAILAIFIGLWGTGLVKDYAAAILLFFVANALALAPASVVFSGFISQAGWFIFGGLLFGTAVQKTGLGKIFAEKVISNIGRSYLGILFSLALIAGLLSFLLPSTLARLVILVPLVVLLAEHVGFEPGSNGYVGIVLTTVLSITQPCYTVLTGAFPNIAIVGLGAELFGADISYTDYLLANFPVLGLLSSVVIPLLMRFLFPDRISAEPLAQTSTKLSKDGRNTLIVMIIALVLWLTDFAHGISPAWVALGAGAFCILPRLGPISDVAFSQSLNFNLWFLCCFLMGLGALVHHVGLGATVAASLVHYLGITPGNDFINFYLISGLNLVITALTTTAGAAPILTPLANELASATGWPVLTVLYMQLPAMLFFPLPYAMPAVVAGVAMGALRFKDAIKALCALAAVGFLIILPLHFLWWRAIGYLP